MASGGADSAMVQYIDNSVTRQQEDLEKQQLQVSWRALCVVLLLIALFQFP